MQDYKSIARQYYRIFHEEAKTYFRDEILSSFDRRRIDGYSDACASIADSIDGQDGETLERWRLDNFIVMTNNAKRFAKIRSFYAISLIIMRVIIYSALYAGNFLLADRQLLHLEDAGYGILSLWFC